jgi:hypothetical protein
MTIEFKNSNEFREFPYRQWSENYRPGKAAMRLSRITGDAQFDLFTDRVSSDTETQPLVVISHVDYRKLGVEVSPAGVAFSLTIQLAVGYGLRDKNDEPIRDGSTRTTRTWSTTPKIKLSTSALKLVNKDDKYCYMWVSVPLTGFDQGAPGLTEGTDAYLTGYLAVDMEALVSKELTDFSQSFFIRDALSPDTPILEDGNVAFTSSQLVRKIYVANKEKIPAPGDEAEGRQTLVKLDDSGTPYFYQNNVKFMPGYNCEIDVNSDTDTVTFVPISGAGEGEPCGEGDPDDDEEGCSDFIYSINGVRSNDGTIGFQGVAPLQIFQGDPEFTSSGLTPDYSNGTWPFTGNWTTEFWTHSLVFRIGDWGPNDDTPCTIPCP